jgi:hypothetical protein
MRDMNLKKNFKRAAGLGLIAASALLASQAAMACQLTAWNGGNSGAVTAGDPPNTPADPPEIARYSGFCGLEAAGQGYVQDDSPGGIDRIRARFYVLLDNTAPATIYAGLDTNSNAVFSISANSSGVIELIGADSGVSVAGVADNWNSVEIDWNPSGDGATLTVNNQSPENSAVSGAPSAINSVRLGNLNGAGGTLTFDSYESRRTEPIGRLCNCNADGSADDAVNVFDIFAVASEAGGSDDLAAGTPDCNEDGAINVFDIFEIASIAGTTGQCVL